MTAHAPIQITGSYPPRTCGIGDYTHNLVRHLTDAGTDVEVWTKAARADSGAIAVVDEWDNAGMATLGERLRQERPHVAHLQYEPGIYDNHPAIMRLPGLARRADVPLVTTFHSLDGYARWGRAHRLALLPLLLGSRDIVVCSRRQWLSLQRVPQLRGKLHLIPVGSNIPVAPPASRPAEGGLRLVYFGFVWRGRNVETMLRALAAVLTVDPQATLTIIGGLRDDAYAREVRALALALRVEQNLTFAGELPAAAISQAFHHADMVLLPYATGVSTGRTTLMTALAHAAPVVTMTMPDNLAPEFVHAENMMLSPAAAGDAPFIENALRLARDPALRAHVSAGAAGLASQFSWPAIVRQVLALPSYQV